jgi:hypothetical protein
MILSILRDWFMIHNCVDLSQHRKHTIRYEDLCM